MGRFDGTKFRDTTHLMGQVCGSDTYVNVWNCQAEFIINGKSEDEMELTEEQKNALEKLKNYIIYTVNNGAINFSGHYHLDELSYEILRMILDGQVNDAMDIISNPSEEDYREKANELISLLDEGDYCIVRNSALDYGCWDGCQGYHNIQYVAMLDGKLVLVDNGCGHHVATSIHGGCSGYEIIKELTEEEAVEMLVDYIKQIADKYNYTKAELENYQMDSECENTKMKICKKHNEIFFDYEECSACYYENLGE